MVRGLDVVDLSSVISFHKMRLIYNPRTRGGMERT